MSTSKFSVVREFADRSTRRLFERGENLRDLMNVTEEELIQHLDFKRIQLQRRTFVNDAFRDRESDLVFTIPFVDPGAPKGRREILLYLLFEHQSEPLADMLDRLLEYILEIRRFHQRTQGARSRSRRPLRSPVVVPLVFYTGTRKWDELVDPSEWEELPALLRRYALCVEPLFINLSALSDTKITSQCGWLAPVLRLMKKRKGRRKEFENCVREAMESCEQLYAADPDRTREFLWYIEGLIRHVRRATEVKPLREMILNTVYNQLLSQEIQAMWKSESEIMVEQTMLENTRNNLRELLEHKFGEIPDNLQAALDSTENLDQLKKWMFRASEVGQIDQVGIKPTK